MADDLALDLFPGDPANPLDRARWPRNDLGAARRLLALHAGEVRSVLRLGWAVWDGKRFDAGRGEALALRLALDLQAGVLAEAAAVKGSDPSPEEIVRAERELLRELNQWEAAAAAAAEAGRDPPPAPREESPEARARKWNRGVARLLEKWADTLGNSGRLRSALDLVAVQPDVMVDPVQMDARRLVLTCANGRLDLGALPRADAEGVEIEELAAALSPHDRADLATRCTRAAYRPGAPCPRFLATVEMFVPCPDERAYLQRCVGYALQGGQEEQVVFVWQGRGANGKSTILDAMAHALGDYMAGAPVEAFLKEQRSGSGHTTELIRLIGARAVRVSEPEPGAAISDSRIKTWTGGEDIPVRELREKGFEARFDGTLFFSTNGTPTIHSTDDGFWRRFQLMPWREQILSDDPRRRPKNQVDAELRAEAEGILAWAVEGWRQYRLRGLDPPEAVLREGRELRAAIDSFGACLRECFEEAPHFEAEFREVYAVFKGWYEAGGMRPLSKKALGLRLRERGFRVEKSGRAKTTQYRGLKLPEPGDRKAEMMKWLGTVSE